MNILELKNNNPKEYLEFKNTYKVRDIFKERLHKLLFPRFERIFEEKYNICSKMYINVVLCDILYFGESVSVMDDNGMCNTFPSFLNNEYPIYPIGYLNLLYKEYILHEEVMSEILNYGHMQSLSDKDFKLKYKLQINKIEYLLHEYLNI